MDASTPHSSNGDLSTSLPASTNAPRPAPPVSPPSHASFETVNTSFAFLVHSQDTIPNNLPPSVDNKPLARQRRRRTSPEDQAILEEEYLRDSKPDKNARKRIVERVALGEKEVQIWFQNRRQNCRRKSRPLLPHEIMSHLEASRGRPTPALSVTTLGHLSESTQQPQTIAAGARAPSVQTDVSSDPRAAASYNDIAVRRSPISQGRSSTSPVGSGVGLGITLPEPRNVDYSESVPTLQAARPPFPRLLSSSRPLSVADLITPEPKPEPSSLPRAVAVDNNSHSNKITDEEPTPTLKRSRSHLRLSLTSDGAAKIITSEESSPSPPRSQPLGNPSSAASNGLRRSFSAAGLSDAMNSPRISEPNFGLRRVPSGRSRDSRSWEFWCDNDARTELQKIADQERTGSAADAISLMRSSSRGPLTPNLNKANAAIARLPSAKRAKTESLTLAKPSLGRTQSSVARLQGTRLPPIRLFEEKTSEDNEKASKVDCEGITPSSGDSDKENWEPDAENPADRRRRLLQSRATADTAPRPVLRESATFSGRSSVKSLLNSNNEGDGPALGPREGKADKENIDPEQDEEVARFMGRGRAKVSPSKVAGEDMDCIQGLLSLSQGAWR